MLQEELRSLVSKIPLEQHQQIISIYNNMQKDKEIDERKDFSQFMVYLRAKINN